MQKRTTPGRYDQGFTMIEIIATLVLLGIISALMVSRVSFNSADLIGAAQTLKGHLRYAQSRAMSLDESWQIAITSTTYTLSQNGTVRGALPGENAETVALASGITMSFSSGASPVTFTANWGIPDEAHTISITDGSSTNTITVTAQTGFIP